MAFTYTWNSAFESAPSDTENVSQGAGRIRDLKEAIAERMKIAHSFAGDADDGKLLDAAVQTAVENVFGLVSGTDMLFVQASAPTGWTQVTANTDRVLRLVDGTGAGTGGSWTISGISVDGHTLTTAQMPAHTHDEGTLFVTTTEASSSSGTYVSRKTADALQNRTLDGGNTGSTGGGGSHTHGLTSNAAWRPAYIDVIQCSKD